MAKVSVLQWKGSPEVFLPPDISVHVWIILVVLFISCKFITWGQSSNRTAIHIRCWDLRKFMISYIQNTESFYTYLFKWVTRSVAPPGITSTVWFSQESCKYVAVRHVNTFYRFQENYTFVWPLVHVHPFYRFRCLLCKWPQSI